MDIPGNDIQEKIDRLTHSPFSFALYRLPWTDECKLVLQTSGMPEQPEDISSLNGKRGFVMTPFRQGETHPLILVRPDIQACGWKETAQAINETIAGEVSRNKQASFALPQETSEEQRKENYATAFRKFIAPLREGQFQKLVLSRSAKTRLTPDFSPLAAFVRACNSYPRMLVYLCHTPVSGTWMGSTPEILLSGKGHEWHTVALAGTMPMQEGEEMPTKWDQKNREEQAYVSGYIRQVINRLGEQAEENGPYTARAGQLVHLKTDFRFRLAHTRLLGDLLQDLHPTPAVCGLPKEEAFRFIPAHEGYDRRYYSGFVGLLEPEGQTDIYVNLRCMEIGTGEAMLYAGGGILPCSEAETEWEETGEKMKTMLHILYITKV